MKERLIRHEKKLQIAWLCVIFFLFIVTRLWQLTSLPLGIHIDEAGMSYDAWCLAQWGVDRHLKSWPVYMMNFSMGQSSLYAFVCALFIRIGGFSLWTIRLPATLFSALTLVFGMKIARSIYKDSVYPMLLVGSLIVTGPFFIMGSRFGLDCNLMLGASVVFLYCFLTALETQRVRWYFLSGLAGGIMLYSYALAYIVLPLFLIFSLVYLFFVKRLELKKWVIMGVPLGILAFPLILVQIVNYFDLPEMQLGIFTITKLMHYRASEVGEVSWAHVANAIKCIFVGDSLVFDSIAGIWNLYLPTAVLFAVGLVTAVAKAWKSGRKGEFHPLVIPLLWFVAAFSLACSMENTTYRVNGIFCVVALLAVEGAWELGKRLGQIGPMAVAVLCGIYGLCFARFGAFYYSGRYTAATYMSIDDFGVQITEGIEFLENDEVLSSKITFVWERSIYYAISMMVEPQDFDVIGDAFGIWRQYWFGSLGEIDDEHNYIVPHKRFEEYCEELRQAGFEEKVFEYYSVYYKK